MKPDLEILPHEAIFGLFLLATGIRLALVEGPVAAPTMFYCALLAIAVALVPWCQAKETPLRWRTRLLFYPVAMNLVYAHLKTAVPLIHSGSEDALLFEVDKWLIGTNLSLRMEPFGHPALTEFFSFCYILFFPYLLFSIVAYCVGGLENFQRLIIGLFSIYGIGFLGYTLLPARGPHLELADQFTIPLHGWWITHWNAEIVRLGSNQVDVFPSLHCAISSFFLFFDRVRKPWRFRLYLLPSVGLWISTIYLRYHYFIDLIAGFALSALGLWIANRWKGNRHELPAETR